MPEAQVRKQLGRVQRALYSEQRLPAEHKRTDIIGTLPAEPKSWFIQDEGQVSIEGIDYECEQ